MAIIDKIKRVLELEVKAIQNLPLTSEQAISELERAVEAILKCRGKVFTTGIGKAGYIARKAASTFSTTGSPAVFLHPGDASHGDVGVITSGDILIPFSNSGKNREIIETVHFAKHLEVSAVIAITASRESPLAEESDIVLELGQIQEACPFGLTPSASTAAMVALADALALTVMELRGFSKEDFATRHHGGYLGKRSREG
jgi:arabinose-5-phosphate isomerase